MPIHVMSMLCWRKRQNATLGPTFHQEANITSSKSLVEELSNQESLIRKANGAKLFAITNNTNIQKFTAVSLPHGSETGALKKAHMELLSVAQCKMERIMLGITLRDHKRNTWIRHQTGVNDIKDVIKKGIHGWAGHIARFKDNRWTKRVTEWTPREWIRRQGRPKTRWRDNVIRHLGPAWPRIARDRCLWRQFREGFLLTEWKQPWW